MSNRAFPEDEGTALVKNTLTVLGEMYNLIDEFVLSFCMLRELDELCEYHVVFCAYAVMLKACTVYDLNEWRIKTWNAIY